MHLRVVAVTALIFLAMACKSTSSPPPRQTAAVPPVQPTPVPAPIQPAPVPTPAPAPTPTMAESEPAGPGDFGGPIQSASGWKIQILPNSVDGTETVLAELPSRDSIPTRTGPQPVDFIVRCAGGKLGMGVVTHSLAETVPGSGSPPRVRFELKYDSGPSLPVLAAETKNQEVFLFPEADRRIAAMKNAKVLSMSFTQFPRGKAQFSFDLGDFGATALPALKKLCPSLN